MNQLITYLQGYVRRPYIWKDLFRQPLRLIQLKRPRERTRQAAYQWAQERAITTEQAITQICGHYDPKESIYAHHQTTLAEAEARQNSCPVEFGGGSNLELIYQLVKLTQPKTVVETGVAYGWSSLAILLALEGLNKGALYSIDRPYMKHLSDHYVGWAVPETLKTRWQLNLGVDRDLLPRALEQLRSGVDLIHYDSDKSYHGRYWAYKLLWRCLKPGGIMISDDIEDNTAFRDFCHREVQCEPWVIGYSDNPGKTSFMGILRSSQ